MLLQNRENEVDIMQRCSPNETRYTGAPKVICEKINKVQSVSGFCSKQSAVPSLSRTMHFNLVSVCCRAMQFPRGITRARAKISNTFHLVELNEANSIKSKATERGGDNPVLIRRKPNTVLFYPGGASTTLRSGNIVTRHHRD
jgi:hypothetical protein